MPAPIDDGLARREVAQRRRSSDEDPAHGLLEVLDVLAHGAGCLLGVSVANGLEQLAVAEHGLLELAGPVERQVPDPQRQDVVLLEGRLEERVVGQR